MPRPYKSLRDYLRHQDNARGMGLARDVKAGQAYETPYSLRRKYDRKQQRKRAMRRA